jgi:TonB family protein
MPAAFPAPPKNLPRLGVANYCAYWLALMSLGSLPHSALAQTAPASTASSAANAPAISDHVKRQAEGPFRWILINSAPTKPAAEAKPSKPRSAEAAVPNAPANAALNAARSSESSAALNAEANAAKPVAAAAPAALANPAPAEVPPLAVVPEPVVVAKREELPVAELPLVVRSQEPPDLPSKILRDLRAESVRVLFTVLPDGSTANASITASTNRRMNDYVIAAVSRWKYAPIPQARSHEVELVIKP